MKKSLKVVVGLGKTGLSCVQYLTAKGFDVAITDSRQTPPGLEIIKENFPELRLALGGFNQALLDQADELIVSPGVSMKEPAIQKQLQRGVTIKGDIELFAEEAKKPIVAITGSNGKSTVTSLVGHLAQSSGLRAKVGGNLGEPALNLLDDNNTDLYVLELSSFQLETTFSLRCLSAVNLNISPDHMDRYDSLDDYIAAKLRIYSGCLNPVINLDDPKSYQAKLLSNNALGFTLKEPHDDNFGLRNNKGEVFLAMGKTNLLSTKRLSLKGLHQYANVLAALAIGSRIGLKVESMLSALPSFQGLAHRCQWVATMNEVDYINDSKGTNVGATQAALTGIGPGIAGKIILLAGGLGKNADFSELYEPIAKYVRSLVLYGQDKELIAKDLEGSAAIYMAADLHSATKLASELAQPGDVVLLSPACASYDMFRDFEQRGEMFMQIVQEMASVDCK